MQIGRAGDQRQRSVTFLFTMLLIHFSDMSMATESGSAAPKLLNDFAGTDTSRYEDFFEYSAASRIVGIEIHAVGMDNTTARYSGQDDPWYEVNNILRITTADGFEAVSGVDTYYQDGFSDAHLRQLEAIAAELMSIESLDPVDVASKVSERWPDLSDEARASIDIALWDLAAKKAGEPLYKMLGASRNSIESYASLPFYETLPEYIDAVHEYSKLGFTRFKFHIWGTLQKDLELVKLVQQTFADTSYRFMIDLESMYGLDDALTLGRRMDEGQFDWFEAPVDDRRLDEYHVLRNGLANLIIPAGYNIYSSEFLRRGIETEAWDAGRFDATVVGGLSAALALLVIANEADLPIDIQSWGHSLAQAANLHLMLANQRTRYFEAPMPKEVFEFGMKNGNLLNSGIATAPGGPGLGMLVDWGSLATADFHAVVQIDESIVAD